MAARDYHVTGTNDWTVVLAPLAANVPSAVIQQVVFQGIIFRITSSTWGAGGPCSFRSPYLDSCTCS